MSVRACATAGCSAAPERGRKICSRCRHRIRTYGDPHFSRTHTLDQGEVDLIVSDPRPAAGLTLPERRAIAARLTERQWSAERIATVVGCSPRNVHRWRAADRTSSAEVAA